VARVVKPRPHFPRRVRLAFIGTADGHYGAVSTSSDAPPSLAQFLPLHINTPLEEINAKINAFQPDVLCGYSSGLYLLSQEQLRGKIAVRPERIISTSEPLTPETREAITQAFGRAPINLYAATESPCMAAQCDLHQGLHMEADWHIFEALDDQLRPVAAGTPGNLFLTNLYNYTQPLIRYRMNDEIVINGHPCRCGSPLPTISNLAGRQEDFLWYDTAKGKRDFVHPSVLGEVFVIGLKRFQYIQLPKNELLMKIIIDGNKETIIAAIRQRMTEILRGKKLDKTVKFRVEVVRNIPNDPLTGKYKLVIPLKD
jgi:phenylacetate-coenzyme A ligase PaaK-like adenylate-forming protein